MEGASPGAHVALTRPDAAQLDEACPGERVLWQAPIGGLGGRRVEPERVGARRHNWEGGGGGGARGKLRGIKRLRLVGAAWVGPQHDAGWISLPSLSGAFPRSPSLVSFCLYFASRQTLKVWTSTSGSPTSF